MQRILHLRRRRRTVIALAAISLGVLTGAAITVAQQGGEPAPASDEHRPGQPPILFEATQQPVATATPTVAGTAATPPAVKVGRLDRLKDTVNTTAWGEASQPDFPISARIPPTYYAIYTISPMLDSASVTYSLNISSIDLRAQTPRAEGSWADDGRTSLTIQLYAREGPKLMGQPGREVLDTAKISLAIGELVVEHWKRSDGAPDVVFTRHNLRLADGRVAFVVASALSPLDDARVAELLGILKSIEVR